ncbi:MAG: SulP family inorganic anion transporter [Planctomycetota bacterium]
MVYRPALWVALRAGYGSRRFVADVFAGLTVALVALPLAMAFGIASIPSDVAADLIARGSHLTPPAIGLYTAIVAGLCVSAFGGSRFQIGGPTGAFIVIVYGVAARHGYDGLAVASLLAGAMLLLMGLCRFGAIIKFIPYPVTTGFTAGIAVIIAASQCADLLGLTLRDASGAVISQPPAFAAKLVVLAHNLGSTNPYALVLGTCTAVTVFVLRPYGPRIPGPILAIAAASAAAAAFDLPVDTIGSRFGALPRTLPLPHLPSVDLSLLRDLLPEAGTIALLCAIESLLSAVVADGMTGQRHHSDSELVGQGIANVGAAVWWGIPATGAIARTVTNIKSGATSPVAGIAHALGLVVFMLVAAPLAQAVPLSALAGLLLVVAWNMSEARHFKSLLRAPRSDVAVLLATFGLTVFVDLTVAVGFGVVAAALLFMKRMADVGSVESGLDATAASGATPDPDAPPPLLADEIPAGVQVFELRGPFFFGVADRLLDVLQRVERAPHFFLLRMRQVPAIDATGMHALQRFFETCHQRGTVLLVSGVQPRVRDVLVRSGLLDRIGASNFHPHSRAALAAARSCLAAAHAGPPPA